MDILLAILGLVGSFCFAGAEAAYTTFNKIRLDIWQKQNKHFLKPALYFHDRPEDFFSTVLIGNNFANILYTTFATVALLSYFDKTLTWALVTLLILFVGEIFPKTLFWTIADALILPTLYLIKIFYFIFRPLINSLNYLMELFLRIFKINHISVKNYFSRDELELLLTASLETRKVKNLEQKYISKVLDFMGSAVREAMIPRTEMSTASDKIGFDDLLEIMIKNNSRFILIYHESLDNIIGVVFDWALFKPVENISSIIQPVHFIPENKSCAHLLREFQKDNISLAVVLDEFGGTAGVVTIDDLIEEVFGEFHLSGEQFPRLRALNNHTWLVDARLDIEELTEQLHINFEEGEYETIAGFILDKIGRIPKKGDKFSFGSFRIHITKAGKNKIEQVKIIKKLDKTAK